LDEKQAFGMQEPIPNDVNSFYYGLANLSLPIEQGLERYFDVKSKHE
jgi:hypothetical protein